MYNLTVSSDLPPQTLTGRTWEWIVLLAAVMEMTKPPATELSLTRNTPSVLMWWARILLALSLARVAWYQAWDMWTVAWVSVSLSATGAATRRLKVKTRIYQCRYLENVFQSIFHMKYLGIANKYAKRNNSLNLHFVHFFNKRNTRMSNVNLDLVG